MDNPEREDCELVLVANQILAQKIDESGELLCIFLGGRVLDDLQGRGAEGLDRKVVSRAKFGCLRYQWLVPPLQFRIMT